VKTQHFFKISGTTHLTTQRDITPEDLHQKPRHSGFCTSQAEAKKTKEASKGK
jgi:hypothetical protein